MCFGWIFYWDKRNCYRFLILLSQLSSCVMRSRTFLLYIDVICWRWLCLCVIRRRTPPNNNNNNNDKMSENKKKNIKRKEWWNFSRPKSSGHFPTREKKYLTFYLTLLHPTLLPLNLSHSRPAQPNETEKRWKRRNGIKETTWHGRDLFLWLWLSSSTQNAFTNSTYYEMFHKA